MVGHKIKNFFCPIELEDNFVIYCARNRISQSDLFVYFMKHFEDYFIGKNREEIQDLVNRKTKE
jgi:hypothetical protein